jgi:hypothetical protein
MFIYSLAVCCSLYISPFNPKSTDQRKYFYATRKKEKGEMTVPTSCDKIISITCDATSHPL